MTTDPLPSEFEDVRLDNWQTRLPSAVCTNKEVFDYIFSLETWKSTLKPDQRERIMKLLPPEILKAPGEAQKTIEDLFSKSLTSFGSNPLDTLFDNLENGHHDPIVVETKSCIVREWRRESRRLMRSYHTKLLQDIVISREQHLKRLLPLVNKKKNGKKPVTTAVNCVSHKRKIESNGVVAGGKESKSNLFTSVKTEPKTYSNSSSRNTKTDASSKNKRGRVDSFPSLQKPGSIPSPSVEIPAKKKARQSQTFSKSKANSSKAKKSKDKNLPVSSPSPLSSSTRRRNISSGKNKGSLGEASSQDSTSLLLGSLTSVNSSLEPSTVSVTSSQQLKTLRVPTLLESLISPVNSSSSIAQINEKHLTKLFPCNALSTTSTSSNSFLQSPVQSSPILASQLQAPSPISVNLSTLTSATLGSSRHDIISDSPSSSSITLNYTQTQTPPPSTTPQSNLKGLICEDSSSDEFEFESIEPTIGFSGPSTLSYSKTSANIRTLTSVSASAAVSALATPDNYKRPSPSSSAASDVHISQKCSLLTNCLTQPLSCNSSSNAAVSAALANNILTSAPVPVSTAIMPVGGGKGNSPSLATIDHEPQSTNSRESQILQHKIFVSGCGDASAPHHQHQVLQKFLSVTSQSPSVIKLEPQPPLDVFQQQPKNNVIITTSSSSFNKQEGHTLGDSPDVYKDDLETFGTSNHVVETHATAANVVTLNAQRHAFSTKTGALNVQSDGLLSMSSAQQPIQQDKLTLFTNIPSSASSLLQASSTAANQNLISSGRMSGQVLAVEGQLQSSLNTQSLQLPSSIMSSSSATLNNSSNNLGKTSIISIPTSVASSSPSSIPNLLDSDDLGLNLGSFSLGGMSLDMGVSLSELDTSQIGGVVGSLDSMKLELDKIDDLSGVLDGNPFDSIPNLSDDLDGLDLDIVDGLCDFEVLLSDEKQYASFFSLIRDVLCSTRDHRMTLICLDKTIRKWSISPGATLNPWYLRVSDWNNALIVALNFLAGNYQDVHPEDFVPYIEYKYKTKYYQWIGAGRDGDNNLTPLCNLWMDNLDRLPPLKKSEGEGEEPEEEEDENEDSDSGVVGDTPETKKKNKRPQTPPPPRCLTQWTVRTSTPDEKELFRAQEKCRFDNPHKAFTYRMHGYESVVGPVKGVYSSQTGITNKARGHSLLVDDRPPFVTILALVRDAVARLPNGEGTRSEICEMLRDSAYLAPEASNVTLNSVVSGALDRLHYERDPCVRYDSHKKSWIYLHRDRTQEQFERLHHNRSYTKSTKSRNSSSRKIRKASSKSSSSSSASTPVTPTPTTIITVNTSSSLSPSSSQSSIEAIIKPSPSATAGMASTASGAPLVTLPPLSSINPKMQTLNSAALTAPTVLQGAKHAIGLMSVSAASPNVQITTNRGLVSFPTTTQSVQQSQPSLNEILAAAAGLRFQPNNGVQGASIVLNQGNPSSGPATRLVLQQPAPVTGQQQSAVLVQQPQQRQSSPAGAAAIAPGQILLSPSAAVLKLAGNIRLGEGVRFAQLRLPAGGTTPVPETPLTTISSPLGLPQHRIILTRGALPGQQQTQGVLLGQTSSGQTVILSAGPPNSANALAGLQQVLNGTNSSGSSNPGQKITLHAATPSNQSQSVQIDSNLVPTTPSSSTLITQQQLVQKSLQQQQQSQMQQSSISVQTYNNKLHQKPGIITHVPKTTIGVSPVTSSSSTSLTSFSSTKTNSLCPVTNSTLPPTSISLPASILAPGQPLVEQSSAKQSSSIQSISTSPTTGLGSSQPQIILTTVNNEEGINSVSSACLQQSQDPLLGNNTTATWSMNNARGNIQSQSVAKTSPSQLPHPQPRFILQPQQSAGSSTLQGITISQGQGQHPLTAPIIIRSAQGEFVSFGIPSNLSLGRGVQGIKVIPFQTAGNKTVLARIVAPPSTGSGITTSSTASHIVTGSAAGNLLATVSSSSSGILNVSSEASTSAQLLTMSNNAYCSQFTQQHPITPSSNTNNFAVTTLASPLNCEGSVVTSGTSIASSVAASVSSIRVAAENSQQSQLETGNASATAQ